MKAYAAGIKKNPPGLILQDILRDTGGKYEINVALSESFREHIREVAQLTSDERLLGVANLSHVTVSLEHLRYLKPKTRIVIGYRLDYTPEESKRLGTVDKSQYDPKTTMRIDDT
jgi:hypothetical protein